MISRLNTDFIKAVSTAEARERMTVLGAEVYTTSPDGCGAFLNNEIAKWSKTIRDAGTKVE